MKGGCRLNPHNFTLHHFIIILDKNVKKATVTYTSLEQLKVSYKLYIYIYKSEKMPYKCKAQYYFELNFNPREKWSRFNFNIPMIHNNNLLYFTATYT